MRLNKCFTIFPQSFLYFSSSGKKLSFFSFKRYTFPNTTDASSLQIANSDQLPAEDVAILDKLGITDKKERLIHFILNERTRECLGEWNRWEELSRTKTLVTRAKLYNPEAAQNVSEKHNLRPIPQKFIDTLQDKNGNNLPDSEKEKWQNPGY